eukprot:TRINITY_DN2845_c0_g1_i9.p2 TRINITY_DN2845_c0_g1~~TRINITY_DN2845_c0_g1_i9.p2  ORF type:complete len:112 (+),score=31.80 TRINITY_DN2845_c0_g1_i9:275-610(+)
MQDIEDFNFRMRSMKVAEAHWVYFKKAADDFVDGMTKIYTKYPILIRSEDQFGRMLKPHVDTFVHCLYEILPSYADPPNLEELETEPVIRPTEGRFGITDMTITPAGTFMK